jgi:hypothetical protein
MPPPSCPYGYTDADLDAILGDRRPAFTRWMWGQTGTICDGRLYDHDARRYKPSPCVDAPHGFVVYGSDLRRFLARR